MANILIYNYTTSERVLNKNKETPKASLAKTAV